MRKIFITGICGFLGSNLALYFHSLGHKVYGADNLLRKGSEKNFKLLKKKGIKIFKIDLAKIEKFSFPGKNINFQVLIHCAALTSVLDGTNSYSTELLYKNNLLSTLNSLKICNISKSKFIYISSSRIYSIFEINKLKFKIKNNRFTMKKNKLSGISSKGINESFSTNSPLSFYGSSKLICENLVKEYCIFNKIPFLINRCGLLAGSGQLYKNDQGIISYWINSWKNKKKLSYIDFGENGYQVRDCLHPWDLSNLIRKQISYLNRKKQKKKIFNVSGGILSSFSLKELSLWCEKNMFVKKIGRIKRTRFFDTKWIVLDNSFAKKTFKWKIKFSKHKIFQDIYLNDN